MIQAGIYDIQTVVDTLMYQIISDSATSLPPKISSYYHLYPEDFRP